MTAIAARRVPPAVSRRPARSALFMLPAGLEIPSLPGAACAGMDPGLFFPERGDGAAALTACARCPVRARCLEGAEERGETDGIWGGKDFRPQTGRLPRAVSTPAMATEETA